VYDRLRPPAWLVDVGLVVLLSGPAVAQSGRSEAYAGYSLLLLSTLLVRRSYSVLSFSAFALLCLIQLRFIDVPIWGDVGLFVAMASIAHYGPTWARWIGLVTGLVGCVLGPGRWIGGLSTIQTREDTYPILLAAVTVTASWIFGDLRRTRDNYVRELEERAARLATERDQQATLAAAAERQRIAREMHDVVAHSLSVMIVQADGGRYAAEHDPSVATRTLGTIAETGRHALSDMRRLLGLLRTGDPGDDLAPQPGVAEVESMVAGVAAAGLAATLEVRGQPRALDPGMGLSLYRIVQEGLTNAMKHGGPGVQAKVVITYGASQLGVSVLDDGRGAAASMDSSGSGHGLVGMRERVELHGGSLIAQPATGGGFAVRATLPYLKENA
jgi:signal transduction histidine kinase